MSKTLVWASKKALRSETCRKLAKQSPKPLSLTFPGPKNVNEGLLGSKNARF